MVNVLVLLLLLATCRCSCPSNEYSLRSSWPDNYSDCRHGVEKANKQHSLTEDSTLQSYAEDALTNTSNGYKRYILRKYRANICSKTVTKAETFSLNRQITTSHGIVNACQKKWNSKISKWKISNAQYGCAYLRNGSNFKVLCVYCV